METNLGSSYTFSSKDSPNQGMFRRISECLLEVLLKNDLKFSFEEYNRIFLHFRQIADGSTFQFASLPWGNLTLRLEKKAAKEGLPETTKSFLKEMLEWGEFDQRTKYYRKDIQKVGQRIEKILFIVENPGATIPPYRLLKDAFGNLVNKEVEEFEPKEKDYWYLLFHHFMKASQSKPSQKFLKDANQLIDQLGKHKFKAKANEWIGFISLMEEVEITQRNNYNGRVHEWVEHEFLIEKNRTFVKGLIWSMVRFHDSQTLFGLARLAEKAYKKIPNIGPRAASVGNACLYTLANSKGLEGIGHLSRLKLLIAQNNAKKLIQKYIDGESRKRNILPAEIEELAIPDFGLVNGKKVYEFDDYTFTICLEGMGKVSQGWTKPDGKAQKTTPALVKNSEILKKRLAKAKGEIKQIKKYLTAQRDRIDRSYLHNRIWTWEMFKDRYLNHGLLSFLTKKLVWEFKLEDQWEAVFLEGTSWKNVEGKVLEGIEQVSAVRLWHPIHSKIEEVLRWRDRINELQVKQPFKQAYREVYLLTDAEINTKMYSNRMAAHLLKQHQFNALTALRGWQYSLLGAYDDGRDGEVAKIKIPAYNLEAQYWINEVYSDDAWTDSGIWLYAATDQVRFMKDDGNPMELLEVPKVVFSEIMRDVDLFVGVCSVGNDPEWRDNGGLPQYREYWTNYSFGDLGEVAKTRKGILENLIPRLKIKDVAHVSGKFLVVKGKLRTYKIHIGSTNILMEPNDQYLCIVPGRGKDKNTDKLFLPFEGDRGLSVILSKAFLLAEDIKITDPTITSQIKRS